MNKFRIQILVPNIQAAPRDWVSSVSKRGNTLWQKDVEAENAHHALLNNTSFLSLREDTQQILVTMIES